ncbi:MAG: biopolymer transporter ExbD [Verrucomicrobiota bacterium]
MNFQKNNSLSDPGFQLAPMIDIIFLLLAFFITTQIYAQWEQEVDISLPSAESGEHPKRLPGEVIVNVHANGAITVNGQTLGDSQLESMLQRLSQITRKGQPILIRADEQAAFKYVIKVLDYCRKSDIWNVSFATGEPAKDEE